MRTAARCSPSDLLRDIHCTDDPNPIFPHVRSTEMYSLHEALAREHMRQREREAQQHRLARQVLAADRWRRLERRASTASRRHARQARRLASHALVD